jgi:hypothetical protein
MASVKILNTDKHKTFKIKKSKQVVLIEQKLPFRIKFISVQVPGYSSNNVPPIGIAIIGFNDYIL